MNYLNENGKLDLALIALADYSAFHGKFYETLDPQLAKLVLDDNSTYKVQDMEYIDVNGDWITQQKKDDTGELMWVKENGVDLEIPRFTPESKTLLEKRIRLLKNGNQLEIIYHQKKGMGRFYSDDDLSLTCLARNIRNTIYAYYGWVDYDFVASHPSVLASIAVKLRIKTPCIDAYVKDKKPFVKMLSDHHSVAGEPPLQKDHIKKLINASLYGGGLQGWATGGETEQFEAGIIKGNPKKNEMPMKVKNYENYEQGHCWWKKFKQEIKAITDKLITANKELKNKVAPLSLGLPDWRRDAKTMSYILGVFENDCLYHSYMYGLQNELVKTRRIALAYDGYTSPPCEHAYHDASFHINGVNDYIFEKTGFPMRMEIKPFEEWTVQQDLIDTRRAMVIPVVSVEGDANADDEHFVDNHDAAINIIMKGLKSRFIFTNDQLYFKEGNLWVNDRPMIMDLLMKHILESKIYLANKHNKPVPYCQNVGTCKSVREGLLAKLSVSTRDDTLYERFHSSTKNKLCFNDGVLDFVEKSFTLWDDIPPNTIFATVIINRNYADYFKKQNTKFIDAINSDIIGNLFGNKSKLALQFFSRAITGNVQDKNFASYCGNRDCGKGILYALFATAFGGYVAPFAIQNMTCERESKKSSDLAKENAWLIPLQYARLAIAQETDDNENDDISNKLKINNKVMKTVMSGGDTILARELWQSPIRFTIDATLAIFGNNELSITNSDSAQHHLKFNGIKQFVTQEAYNKHLKMGEHFASAYAVRDETLKDKVKTDDYANAMVHILYSEYVDKSICIHNAENEDGERVLTLREMLFDKFEFTGDDKDKVVKSFLFSVIKGDKKKIIAELDSLGCVGDRNCKVVVTSTDESGKETKKQELAFKGIVIKKIEVEQIDEPEEEEE